MSENLSSNTYKKNSHLDKVKENFKLISALEMTNKPTPISWIIKNFIEEISLILLFGEPAAGKSKVDPNVQTKISLN